MYWFAFACYQRVRKSAPITTKHSKSMFMNSLEQGCPTFISQRFPCLRLMAKDFCCRPPPPRPPTFPPFSQSFTQPGTSTSAMRLHFDNCCASSPRTLSSVTGPSSLHLSGCSSVDLVQEKNPRKDCLHPFLLARGALMTLAFSGVAHSQPISLVDSLQEVWEGIAWKRQGARPRCLSWTSCNRTA